MRWIELTESNIPEILTENVEYLLSSGYHIRGAMYVGMVVSGLWPEDDGPNWKGQPFFCDGMDDLPFSQWTFTHVLCDEAGHPVSSHDFLREIPK